VLQNLAIRLLVQGEAVAALLGDFREISTQVRGFTPARNPNASAAFCRQNFHCWFSAANDPAWIFSKKIPRAAPASQKDFARGVGIS